MKQVQQRIPNELLSSLSTCLVQGQVFEIIQMLHEVQSETEKQLFQRRLRHIRQAQDEKRQFHAYYQDSICRVTDEALIPDLTLQLDREKAQLEARLEREMRLFDCDIVQAMDQKVLDQQMTLEKAGVPGFYVTNNPKDIQVQMYLIQFMARLKHTEEA
eukprot:TCALIF_09588-PA protein Name:"Similar to gdl Gonadal protein gdl (Drosophila melanogaster)" AED:0.15 eAED:0.18 QI:0/0/0/1/1/1/3/0/158